MDTALVPAPAIGRADRIAIVAILVVGALGAGAVAAVGLVRGIARLIDPAAFPVSLFAEIPLDAGPGILQAHADRVVVSTDALSAGPVWLFAISDIVFALTIAIVDVCFTCVLLRVVQSRPFHGSLRTAAIVAGCAIAFGSILGQGLGGLARMMAATELAPALGGEVLVGFEFEVISIIVGFGVLALAYVFQAGTRLQREVEGLV